MLKNFARWFIIFGLSFLVADVFGWAEQGKAFLYISLVWSVFCFLAVIVIAVIAGLISNDMGSANSLSFLVVVLAFIVIAIDLFVTWIVSMIFNIDFYLAFQIISFISCFFSKKQND